MRYVLDSSVAFKWVVAEAESDKANQLREEFQQGYHELLSPDVFPFELAHALTRSERQGRITFGDALIHWLDVMSNPPQIVNGLLLATRAIAISSAARLGVYDCLYVALAEREGCEFVTADSKLVSKLVGHFPFIRELSTL